MTDFEKKEFSLIVARAGDWTTRLITNVLDRRGPGRMWIRGVQAPGFMYMHRAYKKVVTVCTGAGIAPALPHIEQATSDIMLIWIAKNHRHTYGEAVWKAVTSNLPASQLILHDTGESGRPDIGSLIERAAKMHDAEAVFVVTLTTPMPTESVTVIPPAAAGSQNIDAGTDVLAQRHPALATNTIQPLNAPIPRQDHTATSRLLHMPPPGLSTTSLPQSWSEGQGVPSRGPRTKDITTTALQTSLDALRKSVAMIPTFKSVVEILVDCINNILATAENHKDYEDLASNIAATVTQLEEHLGGVNPARMNKAVVNVIEYVDQLNARLGGLDPAKMARFDSIAASQLRRGGCTPNTRKLVLQELQDWASDSDGTKV
ncbi:hypothetical protein FRC06_008720 [Ceratobasidium sp. 370]|nr:hypothetical protein FRC06_008720 [Ceratobasidium sp. 370]